ncbi:unnamed protein product [Ostreobium quekettii]|uniref:Peptidase S1 domain-containing protein n=1 Tax=Ostreobium quekettii TaxID=121088 RepID=A0A8S1JEJ9_9CHLO|nr:unnamed protein product [Ostreobium quekettii]
MDITIIGNNICGGKDIWGDLIQDSMICAAGEFRGGVCGGDNGGPLLLPFAPNGNTSAGNPALDVVVGITSFGDNESCGNATRPSIFTRVSSYVDWIREKVQPRQLPPPEMVPPALPAAPVDEEKVVVRPCNSSSGVAFQGPTIGGGVRSQSEESAQDCCDACQRHDGGCFLWTWRERDGACFLRNMWGGSEQLEGFVSGQLF